MRIVAGEFKGRQIVAPEGEGTRPTIDRVREALFSSLYSQRGGFEGAVVLDAFAGSGALGLEALSRGAKLVVLYDCDPQAAKVCERNIKAFGLDSQRATFLRRDVMQAPPTGHVPPFDLVFLDPPYAYDANDVISFVTGLDRSGALAPAAIVVYEHAHKTRQEAAAAVESAGFEVLASRKYGKTGITMWRTHEA